MPKKWHHKLLRLSARHWMSVRICDKTGNFQLCDSNNQEITFIKNEKELE